MGMLARFLELAPDAADAPDSISWTPLFWACNNGHGEPELMDVAV